MRKIVIIAIIIGSIWGCESNNKSGLTAGDKIYALYCTQCHGNNGSLQLVGATNFLTSTLTLEERIDVITNGRKTMLPYNNQLSPSQIKAVAEFTMKFSDGASN